jgi:hypothetical protein
MSANPNPNHEVEPEKKPRKKKRRRPATGWGYAPSSSTQKKNRAFEKRNNANAEEVPAVADAGCSGNPPPPLQVDEASLRCLAAEITLVPMACLERGCSFDCDREHIEDIWAKVLGFDEKEIDDFLAWGRQNVLEEAIEQEMAALFPTLKDHKPEHPSTPQSPHLADLPESVLAMGAGLIFNSSDNIQFR